VTDSDGTAGAGADADTGTTESGVGRAVFTYGAPFLGVLLVAVGIGAAVPGAYDLIQEEISTCGEPTVHVESAAATERRFGDDPPASLDRLSAEELSAAERAAVAEALSAPRGEAHVAGAFPNAPAFRNGTLVTIEGRSHYATLVAENPCFAAAPLQLPLGVFAVALGVVGILTPPAYRRLVALEADADAEASAEAGAEANGEADADADAA
jgi:hypothetical protein